MSNALSIAAVTAVLKDLLENGLVSDSITASVGDVIVTALPPDLITVGMDERAQLNLFLYQVTQNRNVDWVSPEFRSKNSRINKNTRSHPPLALDLHYLLTAYGAKDFQAELLLGYGMQLFHRTPAIATSAIANALKNASTRNQNNVFSQALASVSVADLAAQIGQIKLSPEFFNMEDTSKLWSALQTHYRPSASYQASMVLIDSNNAHPGEDLSLMSLSQPTIEQAIAPGETAELIVVNNTLVIRGKRLRGEITRIRFTNSEKLLIPEDIKETQITLQVPSDLSAGVQGVQVVHLTMDNQGQKQQIESNVAAFVLHPKITAAIAQVENITDNLRRAEITVKFQPKVTKTQRLVLLLNEISNSHPVFYSFAVELHNQDSDAITISVTDVKPGTYFVRVRVDGAESPLHSNQSGEYDAPTVLIP